MTAKSPFPARKKDGTFQKGVSGNPNGRPKGSKNRITVLKHMLEADLREQMAGDMSEIVRQMLELAKQGDKEMIKLAVQLHVSKAGSTDEKDAKDKLEININTGEPKETRPTKTTIEAEEADYEEIQRDGQDDG